MLKINIKIINVEWGWFKRLMWRKTALPKGHEGDFARRSIEFWNRTLRNILYIWVVFTKGLLYYENRIALRLFSSIFDLCLSITNHNWKEIKSDCMGRCCIKERGQTSNSSDAYKLRNFGGC